MPLSNKTFAESFTFARTSVGSFVGSDGLIKSAAIDAPRYTHEPFTGENLGLLLERESTNEITYSENLSHASWQKYKTTVLPSASLAPDGTSSAYDIFPTADVDEHTLLIAPAGTTVAGNRVTFSCFIKAGTYSGMRLKLFGTSVNNLIEVDFNLSTETIGYFNPPASVFNKKLTKYKDGWYRAEFTMIADNTGDYACYCQILNDSAQVIFAGDTNKYIRLWGGQVEDNTSAASSYIPTAGSSVTRTKDSLSNLGSFEYYNKNEGSFFVEVGYFAGGGSARVFQVDNGLTSAEAMLLYAAPTGGNYSLIWEQYSGGASNSTGCGAVSPDGPHKAIVTYNLATGDVKTALNGVLQSSTAGVSLPSTIANLNIGSERLGVQLGGSIRDFKYFPRELSDAEMIALTL